MQSLSTFLELGDSTKQWSNRVATLTAAVVIIAIVQVLAKMTWQLGPTVSSLRAPIREQTGSRMIIGEGPGISEQLALAAPFGRAEIRRKAPPVRVAVPETRLDLTLKGVIASEDGKSGGAIIADKKDGDRYFGVGAMLPGGAILDEVHPQQVVLLRNGRQEVLKLIELTLDQAFGRRRGGADAASKVGLGSGASIRPRSRQPGRLNTARNTGVKRAIRIRPLFRGGKIKGFRISPGRDRKLFAEMGFKAGDLLVRINGKAPQSPKEIFSVLDELQNSGGTSVEVTRRGRPVTIRLGAQ